MSTTVTAPAVDSVSTPSTRPVGLHHAAYACRDIEATHHFYEDLMGFPLVYTEVKAFKNGGFFRHIFYDLGDGSCLAFFDLHGVGEAEGWSSAVSEGNGLPVWVNHIAFKADEAKQEEVRQRMSADGIEPILDVDHGWCRSLYYLDPNGIMVEFCRDTGGVVPDPRGARELFTAAPGHPSVRVVPYWG